MPAEHSGLGQPSAILKSPSADPYYTYDVLPPGWIRLLKLTYPAHELPEKGTRPIHISIISVALDNPPKYVALSYTWGAPTWRLHEEEKTNVFTQEPRCYPIHCGDKLLLGTKNLRDALSAIRFAQQTQRSYFENLPEGFEKVGGGFGNVDCYFWIDALCIDQDDLQERAKQVSRMGAVYAKASCCLIWLGNSDDYARTACEFTVRIFKNEKLKTYGRNLVDSPSNRHKLREEVVRDLYSLDQDQVFSLVHFFSRRYFSRLWTVQEAILGPDPFVLCGSLYMDFEAMLFAAQAFEFANTFSFWSKTYIDAEVKRQSLPFIGTDGSCSETFVLLTGIARSRAKMASGKLNSFINVLSMTAKSQATDFRDRIYGISALIEGFLNNSSLHSRVDYTISVEDVYIRTTQAIITENNSLELLYRVVQRKYYLHSSLPSWCPDYSVSNRPLLVGSGGSNHGWHTGGLWSDDPDIRFSGDTILATGFQYDSVRDTAPSKDTGSSHLLSLLTNLRWLRRPFSKNRRLSTRVDMLWRLLAFREAEWGQTASDAIGLIFPAICVGLMILYCSESESSPDTASMLRFADGKVKIECTAFNEAVTQLLQLEPESAIFLPETSLDTEPRTGTDYLTEWFAKEITEIEAKAERANLVSELRNLVPASTSTFDNDEGLSAVEEYFQGLTTNIVGSNMVGMGVFSTERMERLGLGPTSVKAGDEVWYMHGAAGPCILRARVDGTYEFVAVVYIEGLMYGEIAEEPDNRRETAREIAIR